MLNPEQESAIKAWNLGMNVKVTAVPGAGKSRVLLEACRSYTNGLSIILAYNRDLCEETKEKVTQAGLDDQVICLTFHGLATFCIMPAYDDTALFDAIEGAEEGKIEIKNRISVSAVLVDEAQDFRPSFMRLLKLVLDVRHDVQYMVVGDPNQMLYTYDDEDPADLKYLNDAPLHFQSSRQWTHIEFYKTHRLTPSMARVVSSTFGINLVSAKEEGFKPVHLLTINLWKAGTYVLKRLKDLQLSEVSILVPKKKNNGPLKATLNYLSANGIKIYLHGFDGQDGRIRNHKLCIGTWHSSKGTENRVVIVLGLSNESEPNPAFVALTRGMEELVVIQDEENPHTPLMNILTTMSRDDILFCAKTFEMLTHGFQPKKKYEFNMENAVTYSLDNLRPKGTGRWVRDYQMIENVRMTEEDDEEDVITISDCHEEVSTIYAFACCMAVEFKCTGKVRFLEDIRAPHRLQRNKQDEAIVNGHHSRFISPNIPVNTLLGEDMVQILNVYANGKTLDPIDWCELACVARSWNDFHHTMRQVRPFTWFDANKFYEGCKFLEDALTNSENIEFDVRVKSISPVYTNTVFHSRVHAKTNKGILFLLWGPEITHSHRLQASVKAALNEDRCEATVLNLKLGSVQHITVTNPKEFMSKLVN